MHRYIFTLFVCLLLPCQVSAEVVNDFPDDGRYDKYPGVKPVIPLNTKDPTYDIWKTPRKDLSKGRDPGPINVQRYPGGTGWNGIPTFFRLPIALTPDDLRVGDVDVAMLGAYNDMGA